MSRFSSIRQSTFGIIVFLFLLFCIRIGFEFNDPKDFFVGNLIPELIGMCLELLIVLVIFERWQEINKRKRLISLERRLREYLIFFLKHNFKSLPSEYRVGRFFGVDHEKNISDLDKLNKYIREQGLSKIDEQAIQEHCAREASTLDNLLPVASKLTNDHFKAWCRIVYFTNCIATQKEPVSKATIDIIQNIKRFDSASHDRKLYVGAENV